MSYELKYESGVWSEKVGTKIDRKSREEVNLSYYTKDS